jgi:hypothetical protein
VTSFVIGGALLGTGIVVFVTAPKDKASPPSGARLTPVIGLGRAGLAGRF